jgi:O-antigen/teichoic acid export membrane protein
MPLRAPRAGLLSGGALLFASATLVNAGNYLFNLLLGRWLGPAAFADLSLIVTLFLVTSFLTAGLQIPVARFVAIYTADANPQAAADLRRWALQAATAMGGGLLAICVVGAPAFSHFFGTASPLPFVIFGLFVPFYLVQGVDRGVLQGSTRFGRLAVTYQVEMWSRLAFSIILVGFGLAVNGAVLGIGLSFVATWFAARGAGGRLPAAGRLGGETSSELAAFAVPVLVGQLGQILINNSDILIVRHFFAATAAGHYAALALIGRIVFFATWSVVTAMLPLAAQRHRRGEPHRVLLYAAMGAVLCVSAVVVGAAFLVPEQIVNLLFGPEYLAVAPLLGPYALATMFYALANVVVSYRLAIGNVEGTYLAIAAGVAQVVLLWVFHSSLAQVVGIQLGLMVALFVVLCAWDLGRYVHNLRSSHTPLVQAG